MNIYSYSVSFCNTKDLINRRITVPWHKFSPYYAPQILRTWLLSLPHRLFPSEYYLQWIEASKSKKDELFQLFSTLDPVTQHISKEFLAYLYCLSQNRSSVALTNSQLGLIFAELCLGDRSEDVNFRGFLTFIGRRLIDRIGCSVRLLFCFPFEFCFLSKTLKIIIHPHKQALCQPRAFKERKIKERKLKEFLCSKNAICHHTR